MARGGFIGSSKALGGFAVHLTSRAKAKTVITDALISGALQARGFPHLPRDAAPTGVLQCVTDLPLDSLGDEQGVPNAFWKAAQYDVDSWDWEEGFFFSSTSELHPAYGRVSFREKDLNSLLKICRQNSSGAPSKPAKKERLRDANWNEWIAALATLAHEHQIRPDMKSASLRGLIDARLQVWGLSEKEASTVQPVIRTVLERFRINPPGTGPEKP